jgi:hypothetical protein
VFEEALMHATSVFTLVCILGIAESATQHAVIMLDLHMAQHVTMIAALCQHMSSSAAVMYT